MFTRSTDIGCAVCVRLCSHWCTSVMRGPTPGAHLCHHHLCLALPFGSRALWGTWPGRASAWERGLCSQRPSPPLGADGGGAAGPRSSAGGGAGLWRGGGGAQRGGRLRGPGEPLLQVCGRETAHASPAEGRPPAAGAEVSWFSSPCWSKSQVRASGLKTLVRSS